MNGSHEDLLHSAEHQDNHFDIDGTLYNPLYVFEQVDVQIRHFHTCAAFLKKKPERRFNHTARHGQLRITAQNKLGNTLVSLAYQ